ncbi:MAG: RNA polymerase sigma factor [Gammaproteobacteria bacterium]|nr:RNA polymerase sigma factor [Gammaproteobacteria bacterium]
MSGDNEADLIELAQAGDTKAFEKLYRANVGKIHALCMRLCGCKQLAEDLTQEAFIRAWQKLESFRGDSAFSSWLYRLSSNVAIGYLRQQNKWKMVNFDEISNETILGTDSVHEERPDIEKSLQCLPDQARVVVILHEYLGYQHNEIAQFTGMAVGTSKSHLFRAKSMLQARYRA